MTYAFQLSAFAVQRASGESSYVTGPSDSRQPTEHAPGRVHRYSAAANSNDFTENAYMPGYARDSAISVMLNHF